MLHAVSFVLYGENIRVWQHPASLHFSIACWTLVQ